MNSIFFRIAISHACGVISLLLLLLLLLFLMLFCVSQATSKGKGWETVQACVRKIAYSQPNKHAPEQ